MMAMPVIKMNDSLWAQLCQLGCFNKQISFASKRGSVFGHIMDSFGSSGELDINRSVFGA